MKLSIQLKHTTLVFLVALLLACFAMPQSAQAVVPAPDGGYPGGNTAEGQHALFSLTTGTFNTAVGRLSLNDLTTGTFNTGVGAGALALNTADLNTATGAGALLLNTTGSSNTATGAFALLNNSTGNSNTATGFDALIGNTEGIGNTATGAGALGANTTGGNNTAIGENALVGNTIGTFNTAVGSQALFGNTEGGSNTAVGNAALSSATGNGNIGLGALAGSLVTTADNVICIGASGSDQSNSCYIGNIFGQEVALDGVPVLVDSLGKLGATISSRRFKEDIKPMDKASEAILALNPVTFRYKSDKTDTTQFGLVAEEVAEVNPTW